MAMTCVSGCKECTGCMSCYDDTAPEEHELTRKQKKDFFDILDEVKEAAMELYKLSEYDAVSLIGEYVEVN